MIPPLHLPSCQEEDNQIEKEEQESEQESEWIFLRDSGCVRSKFLNLNPKDVAEMENRTFLNIIKEWYFPTSQPRNSYEEAYCQVMREAVDNRLHELL